jgi:hypothetical protein
LIFLELAERQLHFFTPPPHQATNSASGMPLFLAKTQKKPTPNQSTYPKIDYLYRRF